MIISSGIASFRPLMAFTCPWPCVSDTAPSASATVQSVYVAMVQPISETTKSFAVALVGPKVIDDLFLLHALRAML